LVRDNHIPSYTRDGVTRVRQGDVDEYFAVEKLLVEHFAGPEVKTDAGTGTDADVVVVSMSKFPTQEDLSAAITALKKQGLRVEIEP
jgi:hypothetical protein